MTGTLLLLLLTAPRSFGRWTFTRCLLLLRCPGVVHIQFPDTISPPVFDDPIPLPFHGVGDYGTFGIAILLLPVVIHSEFALIVDLLHLHCSVFVDCYSHLFDVVPHCPSYSGFPVLLRCSAPLVTFTLIFDLILRCHFVCWTFYGILRFTFHCYDLVICWYDGTLFPLHGSLRLLLLRC